MDPARHILVVFEDTRAGQRALERAAAIADEHKARVSVAIVVAYERRSYGCCIRSGQWNEILDEIALEEIAIAREMLGSRDPAPAFEIVPFTDGQALAPVVKKRGCDVVVLPKRRLVGRRTNRRLRNGCPPGVATVVAE